jgi:F-type H+-transporting ATPase subunit delta
MSRIADRYAKALHAAAEGAGAVEAVSADMAALAPVFAEGAVRSALTEPDVPRDVAAKVLAKLGEDRHQLVRNLFGVLVERHRIAIAVEIPEAFTRLARAARGELEGVVESSLELDASGKERATALARDLADGHEVHLRFVTQPELLGGIRLRLGNTLYDGSLKTQLEDLQDRLMSAPLKS